MSNAIAGCLELAQTRYSPDALCARCLPISAIGKPFNVRTFHPLHTKEQPDVACAAFTVCSTCITDTMSISAQRSAASFPSCTEWKPGNRVLRACAAFPACPARVTARIPIAAQISAAPVPLFTEWKPRSFYITFALYALLIRPRPRRRPHPRRPLPASRNRRYRRRQHCRAGTR